MSGVIASSNSFSSYYKHLSYSLYCITRTRVNISGWHQSMLAYRPVSRCHPQITPFSNHLRVIMYRNLWFEMSSICLYFRWMNPKILFLKNLHSVYSFLESLMSLPCIFSVKKFCLSHLNECSMHHWFLLAFYYSFPLKNKHMDVNTYHMTGPV